MDQLTTFIPAKPRKFSRQQQATATLPVTGPVLVSVAYDYEGPSITMNFDREIDIESYDGTQIVLNDGIHNHQTLNGTGGLGSVEGNQVQIYLTDTSVFGGSTSTMTATAITGIRDANDGAAWAGVTGYQVA